MYAQSQSGLVVALCSIYNVIWEDREESELFHPVEVGEGVERDDIRIGSSKRVLVLRIRQVEYLA